MKSMLLLHNIAAFLNSNNLNPILTQLDICSDVPRDIENLLVVPVNRKSRKKYYPLGKYDEEGNTIQRYEGTFEVEKFETHKSRNNVMKLAYLYNKRKKEIDKADNDIGYNLTRLEMKLQSRFFLNNHVSVISFLKELNDYLLYYFEDIKHKEIFTKKYNKANSNKHRNQLIEEISGTTPVIKTNMNKIGEFIRVLDTIRFDSNGRFVITKQEDYLYGTSQFNK